MRPPRRRLIARAASVLVALGLATLPAVAPPVQAQAALEPLSAFPKSLVEIRTRGGNVHPISVWIANQPSRQEQGLMFVSKLPDHQGMLFVYPRPRQISMWMKNTLISLDMLFIRADGTIAYIAARTTPQSLDIITAAEPARAVLEIAGGLAEELGIGVGDRVYTDALSANGTSRPAKR